MLLTPAQIKPKLFESRQNFFFFLPGVDASHVYVRAWALGCFHSTRTYPQYPNLSGGVDRVGGQLRGDKECPFSGVTKSGRVWRKVPESDVVPLQWRNQIWQSLEEGAGKRCSECDRAVDGTIKSKT